MRTLKFALPPTRNPVASQWNIGCVRSQTQNTRIGHVHFFSWLSISFALGPVFQWNMGLKVTKYKRNVFNYFLRFCFEVFWISCTVVNLPSSSRYKACAYMSAACGAGRLDRLKQDHTQYICRLYPHMLAEIIKDQYISVPMLCKSLH